MEAMRRVAGLGLLAGVLLGLTYVWGHHEGYGEAQREFARVRHTYTDVAVLIRHDSRHFTLQPARMAPFEAATCEAVDWQAGEHMKQLTYQQRYGCKDVGLGGSYTFYVSSDGSRLKGQSAPEETTN